MRALQPLLIVASVWLALPAAVAAEDGPQVPASVRRAAVKRLGRQLQRQARSPHAVAHKEKILTLLSALEVLGGPEAAKAALSAAAHPEEDVRTKVFAFVEKEHDPSLVAPLGALLEEKEWRRDADLRQRVAHALSVMADASAVEPLSGLVRTDEDPEVVAAAADALATYRSAPLVARKEAVRQLIDVYTATWNLMMSIQPEDRVISARMKDQWRVYGRPVRLALQALTGQDLSRAQEWRSWWNDNKKRTDW